MTRGLLRAAASSRPAEAIVAILERLDSGRSHLLPVLGYHRVCDPVAADGTHSGLCVSPRAFKEQLDALAARYEVLSLPDVLEAKRGRLRLPRRSLLITFDDGYEDFGSVAWPMLRERSMPAALFVPTGYPDTGRWFWWDRLAELVTNDTGRETISSPLGTLPVGTDDERRHAFAALRGHGKRVSLAEMTHFLDALAGELGAAPARGRTLGWGELRRLAAEGVTIAPHSRTHPILTTLHDDVLEEELRTSRTDIEREIGTDMPCFAYPSGVHDERVVQATEAAGYEVAFATRRGINDLRRDRWMTLDRINVGSRTTGTHVRAQVGSWMALRPGR